MLANEELELNTNKARATPTRGPTTKTREKLRSSIVARSMATMVQRQETRGLKCRPTRRVSRQASIRLDQNHSLTLTSGTTKEDDQQSCLLLDKFNLLIGADTTAKNVVIRDAQSRLRVDSPLLPTRRTATRITKTTSSSFIQENQHDEFNVLNCLKRQRQQQIRRQSRGTESKSSRSLASIPRRGVRADLPLIMPSIMTLNLLFVVLVSSLLLAGVGIDRGIRPVSGQLSSFLNWQTTNSHTVAAARRAQAPMQPHQMEMMNTNEPLEGEGKFFPFFFLFIFVRFSYWYFH